MNFYIGQRVFEIAMPTLLLFVAFTLKVFVNRKATGDVYVSCLLELPMDVIFLSLGYTISMMLVDVTRLQLGLIMFVIQIMLAIFTFAFCRSSLEAYKSKSSGRLEIFFPAVASQLISITTYVIVAMILLGG